MNNDDKPNRQDIYALIKALTGQANILTIPRVFIDYTGSLDAALLLSQIIYWDERAGPDGWFYKSYINWKEEVTLGEHEIRKAVKLFRSNNLLTTKIQKVDGNPTLHYKFHMDSFSDSLLHFLKERKPILLRNEGAKSEGTLHHAETTIERKGADALPAPDFADTSSTDFNVSAVPEKKPARVSSKKRGLSGATDRRAHHPAIEAVRELAHRYPDKLVWDEIIEKVGDAPDKTKMTACATAWAKKSTNMGNLDVWLFDWYFNGIPASKGNGAVNQPQPHQGWR